MTDQDSNPSVLGFVILIMRKSAVMTLEDMDLIDVYSLTDDYPFKPLNMTQLRVPHSKSFLVWTVTLGQYAIANFMKNSVFVFSIFPRQPFFIWEKPQKLFLGSNAYFFKSDTHFFIVIYIFQLLVYNLWKNNYTF